MPRTSLAVAVSVAMAASLIRTANSPFYARSRPATSVTEALGLLGLRMTEFVELVSQGNVIAMLLFIAFVCLVLGLGVPTTANYVLVATLMAPVVVELGAQSGLIIPLIAVHLFVFYYGIIADLTPPVALAALAAAPIAKASPDEIGWQATRIALAGFLIPFMGVYEPTLMMQAGGKEKLYNGTIDAFRKKP